MCAVSFTLRWFQLQVLAYYHICECVNYVHFIAVLCLRSARAICSLSAHCGFVCWAPCWNVAECCPVTSRERFSKTLKHWPVQWFIQAFLVKSECVMFFPRKRLLVLLQSIAKKNVRQQTKKSSSCKWILRHYYSILSLCLALLQANIHLGLAVRFIVQLNRGCELCWSWVRVWRNSQFSREVI